MMRIHSNVIRHLCFIFVLMFSYPAFSVELCGNKQNSQKDTPRVAIEGEPILDSLVFDRQSGVIEFSLKENQYSNPATHTPCSINNEVLTQFTRDSADMEQFFEFINFLFKEDGSVKQSLLLIYDHDELSTEEFITYGVRKSRAYAFSAGHPTPGYPISGQIKLLRTSASHRMPFNDRDNYSYVIIEVIIDDENTGKLIDLREKDLTKYNNQDSNDVLPDSFLEMLHQAYTDNHYLTLTWDPETQQGQYCVLTQPQVSCS